MASKQAKSHVSAKGVLIEEQEEQKQMRPAKGRPVNKYKRMETLKECLFINQKCKNIHNHLKRDQ